MSGVPESRMADMMGEELPEFRGMDTGVITGFSVAFLNMSGRMKHEDLSSWDDLAVQSKVFFEFEGRHAKGGSSVWVGP